MLTHLVRIRRLLAGTAMLIATLVVVPGANAAAPSVIDPPVISPSTPMAGDTLFCDDWEFAVEDDMDPALTEAYAWFVDGVQSATTQDEFDLSISNAGSSIVCRVTVTDSQGSGSATSAPVVSPDMLPDVPLVRVVTSRDRAYSCSVGKIRGGHVTSAIAWLLNGSVVPDATQEGFRLAMRAGQQLACRVTASNSVGTKVRSSAAITLPVDPVLLTPTTIVGAPEVGTMVTCQAATWDKALSGALVYQWTLNGSAIVNSGATLRLTKTYLGKELRCRHGVSRDDFLTSLSAPVVARLGVIKVIAGKQAKVKVAAGLKFGVVSQITASHDCSLAGTLTIPAAVAKRLGLLSKASKSKAPVVIATGKATGTSKVAAQVKFLFTAKAKRALAKQKSVAVTQTITATGGVKPVKLARTIVLG